MKEMNFSSTCTSTRKEVKIFLHEHCTK